LTVQTTRNIRKIMTCIEDWLGKLQHVDLQLYESKTISNISMFL